MVGCDKLDVAITEECDRRENELSSFKERSERQSSRVVRKECGVVPGDPVVVQLSVVGIFPSWEKCALRRLLVGV